MFKNLSLFDEKREKRTSVYHSEAVKEIYDTYNVSLSEGVEFGAWCLVGKDRKRFELFSIEKNIDKKIKEYEKIKIEIELLEDKKNKLINDMKNEGISNVYLSKQALISLKAVLNLFKLSKYSKYENILNGFNAFVNSTDTTLTKMGISTKSFINKKIIESGLSEIEFKEELLKFIISDFNIEIDSIYVDETGNIDVTIFNEVKKTEVTEKSLTEKEKYMNILLKDFKRFNENYSIKYNDKIELDIYLSRYAKDKVEKISDKFNIDYNTFINEVISFNDEKKSLNSYKQFL